MFLFLLKALLYYTIRDVRFFFSVPFSLFILFLNLVSPFWSICFMNFYHNLMYSPFLCLDPGS